MSHRDIPVECYDAADYTDTKKLPQWAIEDLEKSGLDKDSVRLMQCIPVLNSDHLKDLLGFNQIDGQDILTAVGDAYAIPYWENEPDKGEEIQPSFYRVKLQKPFIRKNGNEIKYLSPPWYQSQSIPCLFYAMRTIQIHQTEKWHHHK